MNKKTLKANLLILFSFVFFLFASAFTLRPQAESAELEVLLRCDSCCTCTFGSGGAPSGCKEASYCGMTKCEGACEGGGTLCGECEGLPGG